MNPTVTAIMLTANRPAFVQRAIEAFEAQTYPAKKLLILDTGREIGAQYSHAFAWEQARGRSVGVLRNVANTFAKARQNPDIFVHWDDDDWSHPSRIAEQVELLVATGADAVGYREMLFRRDDARCEINGTAETWLYSNPDPRYCLGTSLCYWRRTWERCPFPDTSQGEDLAFLQAGMKTRGVPSLGEDRTPRMIARIHAGNTSNAYDPAVMRRASEWRRVPEWDQHCGRAAA